MIDRTPLTAPDEPGLFPVYLGTTNGHQFIAFMLRASPGAY
ncbi:hypothetical protein AB0G86_31400 [Streptomyces scabiei]